MQVSSLDRSGHPCPLSSFMPWLQQTERWPRMHKVWPSSWVLGCSWNSHWSELFAAVAPRARMGSKKTPFPEMRPALIDIYGISCAYWRLAYPFHLLKSRETPLTFSVPHQVGVLKMSVLGLRWFIISNCDKFIVNDDQIKRCHLKGVSWFLVSNA